MVREAVILAHGLWMGGWSMQVLRLALTRHDYAAHSFDYRSLGHGLDEHARRLAVRIAAQPGKVVHLVGHSLGGLVILRCLKLHGEQRIGRIVLLGTPVKSCMAGLRMEKVPGGEHLLGASREIWRGLPEDYRPRAELGVIAGTVPRGLARLVMRLPGPNDGVVRLEETEVTGMRARIALPVSHSGMLVSARVAEEIASFLQHGAFSRSAR